MAYERRLWLEIVDIDSFDDEDSLITAKVTIVTCEFSNRRRWWSELFFGKWNWDKTKKNSFTVDREIILDRYLRCAKDEWFRLEKDGPCESSVWYYRIEPSKRLFGDIRANCFVMRDHLEYMWQKRKAEKILAVRDQTA